MVNVIVVDDDFDTVEVFAEFLSIYDVNVIGKAYDGREGVELYEKTKPDIVFSDMMMPNYDGFYLLREMKAKWPKSKVIIVTADMRIESEDRLMELGANAVVFKPFRMEHIKAAIDYTLENDEPKHFKYCKTFQ